MLVRLLSTTAEGVAGYVEAGLKARWQVEVCKTTKEL